MGRWGDGEMGEVFIKGNYPDMILSFTSTARNLFSFKKPAFWVENGFW
ncbi:MAG: hypothetical protein F6J90_20805 [Moorea sp. SIOASIH]|nr:hypothetical protein [Moorena sp. SIOASIH]NEO38638.1 hypothetical protein [Moorena sp. SIOASIH]